MEAFFVWEKIQSRFGRVQYRQVTTGHVSNEISTLPDGWEKVRNGNNQHQYYNRSLRISIREHPLEFLRNDTLNGLPYSPKQEGDDGTVAVYRNLDDDTVCAEPDIVLPYGWERATAYNGKRFYYNSDRQEYSFLLPGFDDPPLRLEKEFPRVERRLQRVERDLGGILYYLHNREVLSRCDRVIAWSLIQEYGIEQVIRDNLPPGDAVFPRSVETVNIFQLLNLVTAYRLANIDVTVAHNLQEASLLFYELKKESRVAVHQQILSPRDLDNTMNDILGQLGWARNEPGANGGVLKRYMDSLEWIRQHHSEYLRDGDFEQHIRVGTIFPLKKYFGRKAKK